MISAEGVDGVTFFDLTGSSMWPSVPERTLRFDERGVIEALPRDRDTWMVIDEKPWFFALTDQLEHRRGRGVRAEAGALAARRGLRGDRPAGGPHRRPGHHVLLRD